MRKPRTQPIHDGVLRRMVDAVEHVRKRMLKVARTLGAAGIPYAVVGGSAVAAWVATVDLAAVRSTQDVNVLLRRDDFEAARAALASAGFVHRRSSGIDLFLDHAGSSVRDAVHIVYASELVRSGEPAANPDIAGATEFDRARVLDLESLARIKLAAFRRKDRVHRADMIGAGLIDASWLDRLPEAPGERPRSLPSSPDA